MTLCLFDRWNNLNSDTAQMSPEARDAGRPAARAVNHATDFVRDFTCPIRLARTGCTREAETAASWEAAIGGRLFLGDWPASLGTQPPTGLASVPRGGHGRAACGLSPTPVNFARLLLLLFPCDAELFVILEQPVKLLSTHSLRSISVR